MTEIVYQVALDISYHKSVPGIMTVIPVHISDSDMQKLIDKNMLWRTNDSDINLSFGYTKLGERFMGATDNYSSIVDLSAKMITTALEQIERGINIDNKHYEAQQEYADSLNATVLYVDNGMILPPGFGSLFTPDKIKSLSSSIPTVGRLKDIVDSSRFNIISNLY